MKPATQLPDLMQRIEELREESRRLDITGDEYRDNVCEREKPRVQLREQRHREHLADMERAQAMPEVCQFGVALDPTPHRQHCKPTQIAASSWITPAVCTLVLAGISVSLLLEYFGVLVP